MNRLLTIACCVVLIAVGYIIHPYPPVHAQNPDVTPWQVRVPAGTLHTSCTILVNTTTYCYAGDGGWASENGGQWVKFTNPTTTTSISWSQITGIPPLVNTFNGNSGTVTYTPPATAWSALTGKPTSLTCTTHTIDNTSIRCPSGSLTLN